MKGKCPIILFFLYFVLQGALCKWWVPSSGIPLYLVQYALLYGVYLSMPRNLQTDLFHYMDGIFCKMAVDIVYFSRILDQKQNEKREKVQQKQEASSLTLPSRVQ